MPSDRFILLLLVVVFSAYAASRHRGVREPMHVGSAVGMTLLGMMLAK
ncbi:hypothetical protein GR925_22380 [Streptomyces sp. HUCO-GS316]|nr:hypothetical protein [Streptomyces sp. HUCO-GS316]MXM66116.1 hypothetical protein [Streptomyces sp. HUCO-GS316]